MVDINADGFLDIYVCNSGDVKGDNKENELFINNGDLTFTESATKYGLNDSGYSTHASFFDFDKDGDLDVYILNNSFQAIGSFNLRKNERPKRDAQGGDKLLENQDGVFIDVSEKAGIYGSVIGFGLGITIGDVNNDGWEDIYISNDFFERDYLYINQQNGTFEEQLTKQIQSTSAASMGADIADIDNDGLNDIFVTDMLPVEYSRLKTVTTFDDWDRYMYGVNNGYHHQFNRNSLQRNNGNGTFSEIGRYAGVEASDWSWGALFFDMDNDGLKDLFIANGIYRDLTDQDYLQYVSNESVMASVIKDNGVNYKELIDIIPSRPIPNQSYQNIGNATFQKFKNSGINTVGFSNGSAYGDLDNDGDLDMIVNNVNMPSFVYENKADKQDKNNHIKLKLVGDGKNVNAIGASIQVKDEKNNTYYYENQPARGFQSSMDNRINIGLGKAQKVRIEIRWPSGKISVLENEKVNQYITISEKDGKEGNSNPSTAISTFFTDISPAFPYIHTENSYTDFNRERLNYHMMSTVGPRVAYGDINGDGIKDFVIPGPKDMATQVWLGTKTGGFIQAPESEYFIQKKEAEHTQCLLFDADGDKDLDLYVVSGGVELSEYSEYLYDEILMNDGKGVFASTGQKLPSKDIRVSSSSVASADIDHDGDLDLFVGERVKIGQYGAPCSGYLLVNDGKGNFSDQTSNLLPEAIDIGMITDGTFADLDGDTWLDLIVVGEFMEINIFKNDKGKFKKIKLSDITNGWWNTVKTIDIDNDGDLDIIAGNLGINTRFRADAKHPVTMYFDDFDKNGSPEGILCHTDEDGKTYPFALRHNLMARMPILKKKYPNYASFKNATMEDILGKEALKASLKWEANEMQSMILVNQGNFSFKRQLLPKSAQYAPIFAIHPMDINKDGFQDLIVGGNLYGVQPEMGRYDASYGVLLINDKTGSFVDFSFRYGFSITGEIRDIVHEQDKLFIFRNNNSVVGLQISSNDLQQ